MIHDPGLLRSKPELYWSMLQTAENVASRYRISRERQDQYGAQSQQRACAAQERGLFNDEIAPITVLAGVVDPQRGYAPMKSRRRSTRVCARERRTRVSRDCDRRCLAASLLREMPASSATVPAHAWWCTSSTPRRRGCSHWAGFWALPWLDASLTRWASVPCLRCRNCYGDCAYRSATSIFGS